jgi:hypothetical protein
VLARRSASVLASIREAIPHLQGIEPGTFARSYLDYARAVAGFPRVHLESLQAQPDAPLAEIIERFGLESGERAALLERFHEFKNCTGNNTLKVWRKSATANRILPPDPAAAGASDASKADASLAEADGLLGYE